MRNISVISVCAASVISMLVSTTASSEKVAPTFPVYHPTIRIPTELTREDTANLCKDCQEENVNSSVRSHIQARRYPIVSPASPRTSVLFSWLDLDSEASWMTAWQKNLGLQNLFNNIVKEILNSILRSLGWILLGVFVYGDVGAFL